MFQFQKPEKVLNSENPNNLILEASSKAILLRIYDAVADYQILVDTARAADVSYKVSSHAVNVGKLVQSLRMLNNVDRYNHIDHVRTRKAAIEAQITEVVSDETPAAKKPGRKKKENDADGQD